MKKYEYRQIDHDFYDEDEAKLINSMGEKGWKIIKISDPIKWINSDGLFVRVYYRRAKKQNETM